MKLEILEILIGIVSSLLTSFSIPSLVAIVLKKWINLHKINNQKETINNAEKKDINILLYSNNNNNHDDSKKIDEEKKSNDNCEDENFNYNYFHSMQELYNKRATDSMFKKISFVLAVVMSIIGTLILFFGTIVALFFKNIIPWITITSGAVIEIVAGIYFWLVNRTMKEVKENSKQLEKKEDLFTAVQLTKNITDTKTKDEAYKNIINDLLRNKNNL